MFTTFWKNQKKLIYWKKPPKETYSYSAKKHIWYQDGLTNASYNCLDVNIKRGYGKRIAIFFFDKNKILTSVSYEELLYLVSNFCEYLIKETKKLTKPKIIVYGSASLETSVAMLACARLGFHFSVIFQDLSFEAVKVRARILKANLLISRCEDKNFYNKIFKEKIFSKKNVFLLNEKRIRISGLNSINIHKLKKKFFIEAKFLKGSTDFFTLFTSGSTGEPKGITHSLAGYLIYNKLTCKRKFGITKESTIFTASDAGWINGHSYALFGPLSLGASTVILEIPYLILDDKFLRQILKNCKVTILYLPVTLIRLMKSISLNKVKSKYLKTLGSMGEPLANAVGIWYSKHFSLQKKAIINTYFQTETGGIIASASFKQSNNDVKHGSSGNVISKYLGLFLDSKSNPPQFKIKNPWPGCMKSVINSNKIYNNYFDNKNNFKLYDTGYVDKKSNINVTGRVDDVINIRGHRIGSSEIESTILKNQNIKETCAISFDNEMEGSSFVIFYVSKNKKKIYEQEIENKIRITFGNFAIPKKIFKIPELPKTRSGKILRRLLRFTYLNPKDNYNGDLSTILNLSVVDKIRSIVLDEK